MATCPSKTVLITGATGLLGRAIAHQFALAGWQTVGTGFSRATPTPQTSQTTLVKLDLNDTPAISALLEQHSPAVVIASAASRFPDVVDKDPAAATALNVDTSSALASACAARNILIIYISTDYVFPGAPGEAPYTAASTPNPPNTYGATKLAGEKAVLVATAASALGIVLRIPVLYGPVEPADNNAESAVNVLLDSVWRAQKDAVAMDHWSVRYPTCTEDVGRVLAETAAVLLRMTPDERRRSVGSGTRILQFSAEQRFTKYEMSGVLAELLGLEFPARMTANEQGGGGAAGGVQRPYDTHLSTDGLSALGVDVSTQDFRTWFKRYLGAYKK